MSNRSPPNRPPPSVAEAKAALNSQYPQLIKNEEKRDMIIWCGIYTILTAVILSLGYYFIGYEAFVQKLPTLPIFPFQRSYPYRFSPEEIAFFDGSNPHLPLLLVIKGHVIDVSSAPHYYGKESGYNVFIGRDATRAFLTGCFKDGLSYDLRGFSIEQNKQIDDWVKFYLEHETYKFIGYLDLPPIDPNSPIPNDKCGTGNEEKKDDNDATKSNENTTTQPAASATASAAD